MWMVHGKFSSILYILYVSHLNLDETENQISQCEGVQEELTSSSIKFYELCWSCLASYCVTALNCDKVEMAQAKTGGLSCGWVEPTHGEGLYWGDESREQGASAC